MMFDEKSFVIAEHFGFTFEIHNKMYGSYVCDKRLRTKKFSSYKEAWGFCERHNLNRDVYEII